MDYEDKIYWLEEIISEIGALKETADTVDLIDDYESMVEVLEEVMEDLYRLRELED